jgi:hypothetical protein
VVAYRVKFGPLSSTLDRSGIKFWTPIDSFSVPALSLGNVRQFFAQEDHMTLMRNVDTGGVFKHPVHCFRCDDAFYFTLRKIAEAKKLVCPLCGSDINLTDEAYRFAVIAVKEMIARIDQTSRVGP